MTAVYPGTATAEWVSFAVSGVEDLHGGEGVAVSRPLSAAARVIGPVTSCVLGLLLRGGFVSRRGLLAAAGVAIGQRVAGTAVYQSTLGGVPVEIAAPPGRAGGGDDPLPARRRRRWR